ncbi:single-stranded-DNA-specific exonuclease RecJ [Patulibacter minatonensis]|uniref:single-stranded-DNA-specific exonuclease RecJ n=1 Tax=Patulibacter minatonensis TaxID=298163 RepID=UPI0004B74D9B|nr:single-stranded-DNA-specific exonuclease RecJ [Patulibacter minatonensis]
MRFEIPPAPAGQVARLQESLGVGRVCAEVLVRRGFDDPAAAAHFLAADEHPPLDAFQGLAEAADVLLRHARSGSPIVVHGDYDCDGVCATATLVRALRQVGADARWFLPHRVEDGYGLNERTVRRLAADGTGLVVTVDCGITSVDEAALATELGLDLVITDHHRPRADGRLPDVPIVHPGDGRYPYPQLCGAAVAWRLAGALLGAAGLDPADADVDLDIVALATVADVVPLTGENRWIVRQGLRAISDSRRPGLRALLDVSHTPPEDIDATAVAFRLAPRVNAAGRIGRADVGVELFLSGDETEAKRLADRLDRANLDRREVERRILDEAVAQATAQGPQPVYVLAGEHWHPGVVGIVASRIVERFERPAVLLGTNGDELTGSARSVPGFDLLAGLDACAEHLLRHGGHRAAAGLALLPEHLGAFTSALRTYAVRHLDEDALEPVETVDAVVGGTELGMGLADELRALGPFGEGNPEPVLLVPAGRAEGVRPLGAAGAHVAFTLSSGSSRVAAVAFGRDRLPGATEGAAYAGGPLAGTYVLERHAFRGHVTPRLRVRELMQPSPDAIDRLDGETADAALAVLESPTGLPDVPAVSDTAWSGRFSDRSASGAASAIASLVGTGESVTVVVADAGRRAAVLAQVVGGFSLTDWWSVARTPRSLDGTAHLVALDPPSDPAHAAALDLLPDVTPWRAWGDPELRFTVDAIGREHDLRSGATALYRRVRRDGPTPVAALADPELSGWWLGLLLRALEESGAVVVDRVERVVALGDGPVRPLDDGPTARAWTARGRERHAWLTGTRPGPVPVR